MDTAPASFPVSPLLTPHSLAWRGRLSSGWMVAGSLLIDDALYSYRLHGRNGAADNPVLGGRLHLSSRNWGDTYSRMLDRMLDAMISDEESFVTALGDRQYRRMVLRMRAARSNTLMSLVLTVRSWLI